MRTQGIVGRKIIAVDQTYVPKERGLGGVWNIDRIRLDNGTVLRFMVHELDDDYAVEGIWHPRPVEVKP